MKLSLLREFIYYARWRVMDALLLMLAITLLEGAGVLMLAPLLTLAGVNSGVSAGASYPALFHSLPGMHMTLPLALGLYLGLVVAHSALSWRRDINVAALQQGFVDRLRQRLFSSIGAAEWQFLSGTHSAEFSHSLNADIGRVSIAVQSLFQITTISATMLAYIAAALYLSWPLTLIILATGAVLLISLRRYQGHAQRLGVNLGSSGKQVHREVSDYLAGLKLAKSANAEQRLAAGFAESMAVVRRHAMDFVRKQAASRSILRIGGTLALCILVYSALSTATVSTASVLSLIFIFSRLFPALSQLQLFNEQLRYCLPAYDAYLAMYQRCFQAREAAASADPYIFAEAIRLRELCFRPSHGAPDIVSGIDFTIPVRSTVALIGPSGAGKSTLADLLSGLLAPTDGCITIDGRELSDRRTWRDCVAYVPQDTFLFNASVRENLLWTVPSANEAAVWQALEQAAAADFVRTLPQVLDSVIGERGIRLSGGERQRLAIARALLRKPLLLVLDEATSALDHENERRIQMALTRLHRHMTILIIAHRPATALNADRIVQLEHGKVARIGAPEDFRDFFAQGAAI